MSPEHCPGRWNGEVATVSVWSSRQPNFAINLEIEDSGDVLQLTVEQARLLSAALAFQVELALMLKRLTDVLRREDRRRSAS